MGVTDAARTPFDVDKVQVAAEEAQKAARFRRKAGRGDGLSEELYQRIRTKLLRGELPPTVAAIKRVARGTKRTYLVIDRLQAERVVRQAENGRYQVS